MTTMDSLYFQSYNNLMDKVALIFRAIEMIPRFMPRSKPPVVDYLSLADSLPKSTPPQVSATEVHLETFPERQFTPTVITPAMAPVQTDVATACLSCSRSHLSTVSGALGESIRFAREGGVSHPEVQRRIMLAEDEINMLERIDLAPDALAAASPEEREVAHEYLPKIRKIRQSIGNIRSADELENLAAEASVLSQEFRLRHMQLNGVDLNPVLELAKRVQAGEITMEQAKEELKTILPEEE